MSGIYFVPTSNIDDACGLCLESLKDGQVVAHKGYDSQKNERMQCHFHKACIQPWLDLKKNTEHGASCPKCRVLVGRNELRNFCMSALKGAILGSITSYFSLKASQVEHGFLLDQAWLASSLTLFFFSIVTNNPEIKGSCEKGLLATLGGAIATGVSLTKWENNVPAFAIACTLGTALGSAIGQYLGSRGPRDEHTYLQRRFFEERQRHDNEINEG